MDCNYLKLCAKRNDWVMIKTKNKYLLSWIKIINKKKKIRINIYWSTGTVGICLPNIQEKFIKKQNENDILQIFESIDEGIC